MDLEMRDVKECSPYPKAILNCLASVNFLQKLDMGKDNRLIERGKCKFEDCDCEEFELNDDTSCKYCGDPPAKHQAIQGKSGSQAEQATRAHLAQPSQVK